MLEPWVVWSVSLPSCSSKLIHIWMWDILVSQPLPCHMSSWPWLPVSASPTSVEECFYFNSLVVRFLYSSIFWQFWLVFVFKLVVVLLLVVWGSKVYLPMSPSWPEALVFVKKVRLKVFIWVNSDLGTKVDWTNDNPLCSFLLPNFTWKKLWLIYIHTYLSTFMYIYAYIYVHACIYCIYVCVFTGIYVYIDMCIYVCIHIHTDTHI